MTTATTAIIIRIIIHHRAGRLEPGSLTAIHRAGQRPSPAPVPAARAPPPPPGSGSATTRTLPQTGGPPPLGTAPAAGEPPHHPWAWATSGAMIPTLTDRAPPTAGRSPGRASNQKAPSASVILTAQTRVKEFNPQSAAQRAHQGSAASIQEDIGQKDTA